MIFRARGVCGQSAQPPPPRLDIERATRHTVLGVVNSLLSSIGAEGVSGWGHTGECGARAYNGGLEAEPPAGSRGRAPHQGEAESILVIGCPTEPANLAPFQKCLVELRYT